MFKKLLGIALILALTVNIAYAVPVGYHWTPPTDGSPVVHYEVQYQVDAGEWQAAGTVGVPEFQLEQETNATYRLRVRGVDAEEHPGPWSEPSIGYNYSAPGACGKPERD